MYKKYKLNNIYYSDLIFLHIINIDNHKEYFIDSPGFSFIDKNYFTIVSGPLTLDSGLRFFFTKKFSKILIYNLEQYKKIEEYKLPFYVENVVIFDSILYAQGEKNRFSANTSVFYVKIPRKIKTR
ncbi:MAG: hypothetical protein K8S23_17435 [Candidatus Cloacimonetes bacterium]|nr:hypothetical protein [Candidatus Cloacimonadota bacterium]